MCGVAAIFAYHPSASKVDRVELLRIREQMRTRGPDGAGEWHSEVGRVGMAHRRLSIIDLDDRAAQPMQSADGKIVISYNGEIYNFRQLRDELRMQGIAFRTESDTEVLLALYQRDGEQMFAKLRGMYAFALWDERKQQMLLARDPYGIKPLYYADDGWTVRVASQVKALLAGGKVSLQSEPAGEAGFYLFGSVPEPFTMYQEIRAVPAGSFIWVDEVGPHTARQHFCFDEQFSRNTPQDSSPESVFVAAIRDSVQAHQVADVPVGAFLSGGVDSGALLGVMSDLDNRPVCATTIAFKEFIDSENDESPLATAMAAQYGAKHQIYEVSESEFHADLPKILTAMDQPSIDGINTWFAAKACAARGLKVAVSGVGGDELLGGYSSFTDIPRWRSMMMIPSRIPLLGGSLRHLITPFNKAMNVHPKMAGMLEYGGSWAGAYLLKRGLFMPWELPKLMGAENAREGLRRLQWRKRINACLPNSDANAYSHVSSLESQLYLRNQLLRDTDWASMAHSLEVRTPLVDATLLSAAAGLVSHAPAGIGKLWLSKAPSNSLLPVVVKKPKTGFSTPIYNWLQNSPELDGWRAHPWLSTANQHWSRQIAVGLQTVRG